MRAVLLALCAVLAGCGGSKGDAKVRVALAGPGLQSFSLPLALAQELGFYKAQGVEVELETLPSVGKSLQALVGGSVDVAGVSYPQTLQLAAEGQQLRSFFIMTRRGSNALIIAPPLTDRFRRAEDLKGALLGISSPGSSTHLFANFYLAAHGVGAADFRTASIGLGAPALAAVVSGRVDAAVVAGGDHVRLRRQFPNLRVLVDSSTPEGAREVYGGDYFAGGAAAKPEWLQRNADTARKLARALRQTLDWIASHTPEELREKLPESLRTADAAADLEVIRWGRGTYSVDGRMPPGAPEAMKKYVEATVETVRKARIDLAPTWTDEYLPESK